MARQPVIFLLDIGNSRIKGGLYSPEGLVSTGLIPSYDAKELTSIDILKLWRSSEAPDGILLSSVASPSLMDIIETRLFSAWKCRIHHVHADSMAYGVSNAYEVHPERLGADRWASLIAAHHYIGKPVCIVDCGTTITFDAIDAWGKHMGGMIVPGLCMMKQALLKKTGRLHGAIQSSMPIKTSSGEKWLPANTNQAIEWGILHSAIGFVNHAVMRLEHQCPHGFVRILTGGDAPKIVTSLPGTWRVENDWVLKGLSVIAAHEFGMALPEIEPSP